MPETTGLGWQVAAGTAALLAVIAVSEVMLHGTRWQRRGVDEAVALAGGDPGRGRGVIERVGCGACHQIPGVVGASGRVGPPLAGFAGRAYVGGVTPNRPEQLVHWLVDPRDLSPRTAMPALGLKPAEAQDVAAYLYTLR